MAQVQNLLDLFRQSLPDAQASAAADAKPAPRTVPGTASSGKSGRNQGDLLPIDPGTSRGGNLGISHSPASFRTKMESSAAKLAAKGNAQKPQQPQSRTAASEGSRAPKAKPETAAPRNEEPKRAQDSREGRSTRAQARHAAHVRDRAGAEKPQDQNQDQGQDQDQASLDAAAARQDDSGRNDQPQGLDEKSRAAIKKGLADLGIQVDDKQLQDPAFLADILRLLQSMPALTLPSDDVQSADVATDGADATTEAGAASADATQAAASGKDATMATTDASATAADPAAAAAAQAESPAAPDAKPQIESPKSISRQDLARMLEDRIGGLERAAQAQSGRIQVTAQAPTVTPKEWQGVQTRAKAEGPSPEPMPIADLDRMRVLQASALQAGPARNDAAGPRTDLSLESDSAEPTTEPVAAARVETGRDASASQDQDPQTDLFGQKGDASGAQILGKEAAQSLKDGGAGTQFNQVLEQARSVDHRAALAADVAPRAPLRDSAVLDQIARKMSLTTHKTGDEINIQLSPEHLGKVRVSLEMKEDGMSARIAVENDSVRKQVEENISALKDALKDQGIQLQGLEVSVDQRHASLFNPDGSNAESFFRRQGSGNGQGDGGMGSDSEALESAPESDTGRRWGYNTMEYIG